MVAGAYTRAHDRRVARCIRPRARRIVLSTRQHSDWPWPHPPEGDRFMRPQMRIASRRALALLMVAFLVSGAMARLAAASGGGEPPSMPPSAPPSAAPEQPASPEEKAASDRKTAEGLYSDGYKECDKAKA